MVSENAEEQRRDFQQRDHMLTLFPTPLFDRDGVFHTEYNRAVTLKVNLNTQLIFFWFFWIWGRRLWIKRGWYFFMLKAGKGGGG